MIRLAADEGFFHSVELSVEEHRKEFRNFAFENPPEGYLLLVCQIGDEIAGYADSRVNHNAIEFYASLNFVQESFLRQDEGKKDIIIMSKFLKHKM